MTDPVARRRHPVARRVSLALMLMLGVVVVGVVWVGFDALRARRELLEAATQIRHLQERVAAGDAAAAQVALNSLQEHSGAARASTHGPHWSLAGAAPWVGPNLRAVQTVSEVIDDLATDALPSLMGAMALADPAALAPVKGRVALTPLVQAAPRVVAADVAVRSAARRLNAVDVGALLPQVSAPLVDLQTQIHAVASTTATVARAVQLLPPMLGADGPRTYLLLVQNNAEPRATGGEIGQVVLLRADKGAIQVVEQRTGGSFGGTESTPALPITPQEQALFGEDLAALMVDVTFTPDFPRSGELARAIWRREVGDDVDGVLSIDPGALAAVLGATGPVTLPAGQELTAKNAVQVLLNTVYLDVADPAEQDAFFARAATAVFDALIGGTWEPVATLDALARAAREGRLMVWSAHEHEQELLSGTVLSGELVGVQGDAPVVGVYLNDGSAAKIGYYLRTDVAVDRTRCYPDGSQNLAVTVTLTSTAPANAATLPLYVTGEGLVVPKGEVRTNVLLYAPTGGVVDDARTSKGDPGVISQTHDGLAVVGRTVQLRPGEKAVLSYDVRTGREQPGVPVLRTTPMTMGQSVIRTPSPCS